MPFRRANVLDQTVAEIILLGIAAMFVNGSTAMDGLSGNATAAGDENCFPTLHTSQHRLDCCNAHSASATGQQRPNEAIDFESALASTPDITLHRTK
jgi:hypothetical protein